MGAYINPKGRSKESWLEEFGELIETPPKTVDLSSEFLPVCLMDNGPFTAAGIAFNQLELDAFTVKSDTRPKIWYMAHKEALLDVSNLKGYLK